MPDTPQRFTHLKCHRAVAALIAALISFSQAAFVFAQDGIQPVSPSQLPPQLEPIRELNPEDDSAIEMSVDSASPIERIGPSGVVQQPVDSERELGQANNSAAGLPRSVNVPMATTPLPDRTTIATKGDLLTLVVRDASLGAVLNAIAEQMNLNFVSSGTVDGQISITLNNVPLDDALDAILSVNGYQWIRNRNIIMVSSLDGVGKLSPTVDGRIVRVFHLDFVAATDIEKTVEGLLSPRGSAFATEVNSADKLRHREELLVEDLPEYIARIEAYVSQADQPPAQVLIEAHVLQVSLRDDNRHGVNIRNVARMAGANVTLQTAGIANAAASPAFLLNVEGNQVDSIIEVLQGTTDAKTLASPKVLAVNGQEARIQIGESLGYLTTTTTQTSTVQDVSFLDLGVVLTVTPVISRDGRILMTVKPEVSSGRINSATGLPDSETTEVESTVMLPSGHAMVIGGLIKEENTDQQSKLPIAGDIPVFGKLFQRRNRVKDRSEIIIVLLPRIVPYDDYAQAKHSEEVQRVMAPLLDGPLIPVDRTRFEPLLPNANQYCEPIGKRLQCYPTPPVAYSPYNIEEYEAMPVPFTGSIESATETIPAAVPPAQPSTEFLPSAVDTNADRSEPTIRRVSGIRPSTSTSSKPTGMWHKSRRAK